MLQPLLLEMYTLLHRLQHFRISSENSEVNEKCSHSLQIAKHLWNFKRATIISDDGNVVVQPLTYEKFYSWVERWVISHDLWFFCFFFGFPRVCNVSMIRNVSILSQNVRNVPCGLRTVFRKFLENYCQRYYSNERYNAVIVSNINFSRYLRIHGWSDSWMSNQAFDMKKGADINRRARTGSTNLDFKKEQQSSLS